jgi:2-methylcitrate dehydratase
MDRTIQALAHFASSLNYDTIRPAAIHAAKRSILDSIGCAISSFNEEPVAALRRVALRTTSDRPVTIFGTKATTSPDMGAFLNGSMIRFSDFSDDYFGTQESPARGDVGPHPSDTLGGIFAAAETMDGSGKDLLLGTVIAYEVDGQFAEQVVLRSNGWDYPLLHAIATALAAGRLMGLTLGQLEQAVSLSAIPNVCLGETRFGELSHWKSFAGPNGSRNGLFAAQLAGEGITGPEFAFEGKRGFMRQLNSKFTLTAFGGGDVPFRVERTYFKSLPLRYELQTPVELALRLRNDIAADDIAAIRVFMDERSLATRENDPNLWNPMTRETADHSGPYLIGAAFIDGKISHATFTEQRFRDPTILALVDKIEAVPDRSLAAHFPWRMICKFEVTLKSGEVRLYEHENPKGHPQNAMTDADIEAKFLGQAADALSPEQARKIIDCVWSLEKVNKLSELLDLLVPGTAAGAKQV